MNLDIKRSRVASARALIVMACLASGSLAAASGGDEGRYVDLWTRKPGSYADGTNWPKGNQVRFDLDAHLGKAQDRYDFQYGRKYPFRGVLLKDVILSYKAPPEADTVLLHFANRMIVPIPRDESVLDRLGVLVAREVRIGKSWSKKFPSRSKNDPIYSDPRPINFSGNKLVVASAWHPGADKQGQSGFTPWRFSDALTGVEFVNRAAYERQFLVDDSPSTQAGLGEFMGRCAFCHSARQIGSRFGWDFVDPLPTYKQKAPEHLLNHVKYPKWDALERGLMMPAQKDVTSGEIFLLWKWMEAVATKPAKPYAP